MTLIGIACKGDHVDVLTDTASYLPEGVIFTPTTKVRTLTHLDALVMTSGSGRFAHEFEMYVGVVSKSYTTFDDFMAAEAPALVKHCAEVAELSGNTAPTVMGATAYFVGRSDTCGEFVAYALYPEDDNPSPVRLTGTFLRPAPMTLRPRPRDLKVVIRGMRVLGATPDEAAQAHADWSARPPAKTPQTDQDWIDLANLAREERALCGPGIRVWVGGDLFLTTLRAGEAHTRRIGSFNDTGDDLDRLLAGSLHPLAQHQPCAYCDSGAPAVTCCMADDLHQPCPCGSGDRFEDCHLVGPDDVVPRTLWTALR